MYDPLEATDSQKPEALLEIIQMRLFIVKTEASPSVTCSWSHHLRITALGLDAGPCPPVVTRPSSQAPSLMIE